MNQDAQPKESPGVMMSIIIVFLVIVGGAYYFSKRVPRPGDVAPAKEVIDPLVAAFSAQGSSDEIADIQKDIASTPDLSLISADLENVLL